MIIAHNLSVRIGHWTILDRINFAAAPGEFTTIIGPNGSGKTTLLKALCADLAYTGSATLHGEQIAKIKPRRAAGLRAVLPQSTVLSFPFTVREVVMLGLTGGRPGVERNVSHSLPDQALEAVDLAGFGGRYYSELSGGEQQRVQLARVLCQIWKPILDGVPRYLMLDEPVSSLDINHQLQILKIARQFAEGGGGVIAVLHDLNLATMFSDRIAVIKGGRVHSMGTPAEVIDDETVNFSFNCQLKVGQVPAQGLPFVLPQSHSFGENS